MFTRERLTRWTKSLRENPHLQGKHVLHRVSDGKMCCLGNLCEVEGIPKKINTHSRNFTYIFGEFLENTAVLRGALAEDFGNEFGRFSKMKMPDLRYKEINFSSASAANDQGVPWSVIADHFDRHYPCSDEQSN